MNIARGVNAEAAAHLADASGEALRVTATQAALTLIETLAAQHGPILFHQSGGCCDGSSPMCYAQAEFKLGDSDVELGRIGGAPVYISRSQHEVWRHTQLIIDVVPGRGGMFSLENGTEQRFLTRSRIFTPAEIQALETPHTRHTSAVLYPVPDEWARTARITEEGIAAAVSRLETDPDGYWAEIASGLDWIVPPTRMKDVSFQREDFHIRWFEDGVLNVAANCIDRHLPEHAQIAAFLFEGDEPGQAARMTYAALHEETSRMANVLKSRGVAKGDRVVIYLPMIPMAAVAMLACARIGAVHAVVFGGFAADSIANRIQDCGARVVITADQGRRAGRRVNLKTNIDKALASCPDVHTALVLRWTGADISLTEGRDIVYEDVRSAVTADCAPEPMAAEDPLFILYTSGSTGKPKGVMHTTGGYLAWVRWTHAAVFDYRQGEVFWCTADIGWITGHSYAVYGVLANGGTSLIFEGVPSYPTPARFWEVIDAHAVNIFYTAPTALRALMREGDGPVLGTSRASLRLLGSVGEPINPEAWEWYHRVVGGGRLPIVDSWWQTETGGILIAPLPGAVALKPGSATFPLPGVVAELVDAQGQVLEGAAEGNLCLADSWPGQMRGVYGDPERFFATYFTTYPGRYFTGDGARRDADGYYWITGRVDDVVNVSGHRLGTAELEAALDSHPKVSEAAVVGYPHDIKGQGIYCYVTLNAGAQPDEALRRELVAWVRQEIGPFAAPDAIQWAPGLPKTRSGKIMRRILRKIAENELGALGDISTLADPSVVEDLIRDRVAV